MTQALRGHQFGNAAVVPTSSAAAPGARKREPLHMSHVRAGAVATADAPLSATPSPSALSSSSAPVMVDCAPRAAIAHPASLQQPKRALVAFFDTLGAQRIPF